jgi:hypothetical protein
MHARNAAAGLPISVASLPDLRAICAGILCVLLVMADAKG